MRRNERGLGYVGLTMVLAACSSSEAQPSNADAGSGAGDAQVTVDAGAGDGGSEAQAPADASAESSADTLAVNLRFKGLVAGQPFSCTQTVAGIGTNVDPAKQQFRGKDFRFYVYNVRLVNDRGEDVSVALKDDGAWQNRGLALLDFEDGTGACENGNPPTNATLVGDVPKGAYKGLKFTVGIPEDRNHLNLDLQPSPLNLSAMYWDWTFGYRFMRIEGAGPDGVSLAGGLLHLGSTGCTPNDATDLRKGSTCTASNRPEVHLADFDPAKNAVVIDAATLFHDTDLVFNTPDTAPGCMSFPEDPECEPMFPKLGLVLHPTDGGTAPPQTLFTME